ncbi:MAG: septum formation protein Maf [Chitinophagaceae bacterium]|nr:MAG: septum formation protein Maf [Chitinophagaceae bacterium]
MEQIILASGSPRRKQLLEWAEIPFEVRVSDADESYAAGMSFEETAIFIAKNKAMAVAASVPADKLVLAADTIVVCNEEIFGKPASREEAIHFLSTLAGNSHKVITGVVMVKGDRVTSFADVTTVHFHPLSSAQIAFYVDHYKPYDKAGAYAIQEWIGVVGIKGVEGDFYNVMGLPVSRVVQALRDF